MSTPSEHAEHGGADEFTARRRQIAAAALVVIAEHGFAKTELSDISAETELSAGVLDYYFSDKDDLIAQAIWQHKSECARRYDPIVDTSITAEELVDRFGVEISSTLREESDMHRLWYDLRNQALFEEGFRETIIAIDALLADMVWAAVTRHAQLRGGHPTIDRPTAYALFDGVFRNCLIDFLRGDLDALDQVRTRIGNLLTASV